MYILWTGSERRGRGVRRQSRGDTRPVAPRRVCACQLHVGTSGSPCERVHRPEVLRRVQPRGSGEKTTPPPGGACLGPANERAGGKVGDVKEHHAFRRPPPMGRSRTGASYANDNRCLQLVRAHGTHSREEPNISVPLVLHFQRSSEHTSSGLLRFPSPEGMGRGCRPYRALFTAFGIRSQDILLRLANPRLYIGSHVREYLVGLDTEWEMAPWSSKSAGGGSLRLLPFWWRRRPRREDRSRSSRETS